jgi:LuxR family maltose regulon positive regulatory protein
MLLKTKFNVPLLRSKILDRAHLLKKLSEGKSDRIISITGQAGAGKTSLVVQWAIYNNLSAAWYSLDETDNDPDLFNRYLLATIGNKNNKLLEGFGPFLQKSPETSCKRNISLRYRIVR